MKTKKVNKKLALNKQTVAALDPVDLGGVNGGGFSVLYTICICGSVTCSGTKLDTVTCRIFCPDLQC